MNCNDCINEMHLLFDEQADSLVTASLKSHMATCTNCSEEYDKMNTVLNVLQPKVEISSPLLLKQNIINQLKKDEVNMNPQPAKEVKLYTSLKRILAVAAIATAIVLVIPLLSKNDNNSNNGNAAAAVFETAINATGFIKNMQLNVSVRTDAKDNFDFIGKEFNMVEHTITKTFEKPEKWRIEKAGRIVLFDGVNQYLWVPEIKQAVKGPANAAFIDWFKILLDPTTILWKEKEVAKEKGSTITMKENGGNLMLSITSKAEGNFINDYLKNKSINASDNRREYVFDNKTKLLKELKVYLLENKTETLILNISHIDYNTNIDTTAFAISLPDGVDWKNLDLNVINETFSNINSKRAAELVFDAMAKNDFDTNKEIWSQFNMVSKKIMETKYGGLEVIKIGEPFKSGNYPGEFIPYEIKLKDGTVKSWKLALRNDNKNKVWMIDGGL